MRAPGNSAPKHRYPLPEDPPPAQSAHQGPGTSTLTEIFWAAGEIVFAVVETTAAIHPTADGGDSGGCGPCLVLKALRMTNDEQASRISFSATMPTVKDSPMAAYAVPATGRRFHSAAYLLLN